MLESLPRRLEEAAMAVVPRMLHLHLRIGRRRIRWWLPSIAVEEPLRFAAHMWGILLLIAPSLARRLGGGSPVPLDARALVERVDALFGEEHRDLLAMPDGAPLLDLEFGEGRILVRDVHPLKHRLHPEEVP